MPYEVRGSCVYKEGESKPIPGGCHDTPKEAYAHMSAIQRSEGMMGKGFWNVLKFSISKALWDTATVNDLPDGSFLYISPGGKKDEQGKTEPRSLRHFPYKDASGKVDLPHLRNAIARIPQSNVPPDVRQRLQGRARQILMDMREGK